MRRLRGMQSSDARRILFRAIPTAWRIVVDLRQLHPRWDATRQGQTGVLLRRPDVYHGSGPRPNALATTRPYTSKAGPALPTGRERGGICSGRHGFSPWQRRSCLPAVPVAASAATGRSRATPRVSIPGPMRPTAALAATPVAWPTRRPPARPAHAPWPRALRAGATATAMRPTAARQTCSRRRRVAERAATPVPLSLTAQQAAP